MVSNLNVIGIKSIKYKYVCLQFFFSDFFLFKKIFLKNANYCYFKFVASSTFFLLFTQTL